MFPASSRPTSHFVAACLCAVLTIVFALACSQPAPAATPLPTATLTPIPSPTSTATPLPTATETPAIEASATQDPEAVGFRIPGLGVDHITPGGEHPPYNSVPATSGWHYGAPFAPAPWGIYDEPLPDEVLVHNLEHGGIGIHYDCPDGCAQLVEELTELVIRLIRDEGYKVLMSPYPNMDARVSLTAWNFLDGLSGFDERRIVAFVLAHESSPNAPEPFVQ